MTQKLSQYSMHHYPKLSQNQYMDSTVLHKSARLFPNPHVMAKLTNRISNKQILQKKNLVLHVSTERLRFIKVKQTSLARESKKGLLFCSRGLFVKTYSLRKKGPSDFFFFRKSSRLCTIDNIRITNLLRDDT